MPTAVISDTHLGSGGGTDLLRREPIIDALIEATSDCERLVLLGDTIELRDQPIGVAIERSRPFFERVGSEFEQVVLVPGNHDHRLLGQWLDRVREDGDGAPTVSLEEEVGSPNAAVEQLREWLAPAELVVRYPGLWLRDDVYATHGHYLDSHVTLPTVERLSVATVDRMGGRPTGLREVPQDYEKVHAPVYDLLFNLAQGARNPQAAGESDAPSMRIWEMLGGASGRARNWRGRILRSAVVPVTLAGLERAGVGRFGRDFSLAEIGRSGVEAMHVVVERLGIDAEHVIFGHIHRRGKLAGEDGRSATDPEWTRRGTTLHNTGCWVYVPAMLGRSSADSPFWPGRAIVVGDTGPPEAREVLAETPHADLVPPSGSKPKSDD